MTSELVDLPSIHNLLAHDHPRGARNSLIIIEHDPLLYEDGQGMVEYVSQGLHDDAKEAAVLLYSAGTDTFLDDMTRMPTEYSTSTRSQELRRSLFRKLVQKRRRARPA